MSAARMVSPRSSCNPRSSRARSSSPRAPRGSRQRRFQSRPVPWLFGLLCFDWRGARLPRFPLLFLWLGDIYPFVSASWQPVVSGYETRTEWFSKENSWPSLVLQSTVVGPSSYPLRSLWRHAQARRPTTIVRRAEAEARRRPSRAGAPQVLTPRSRVPGALLPVPEARQSARAARPA